MAGRNKKKKTYTYSVELKDGNKNMTITFDEKGNCKVMLLNGDFGMTFNIPESSTHIVRLLFFDNYKRLHVWKTRNQRKEERRQEALKLLGHVKEDIPSYDDIIFPDVSFDVLPVDLPDILPVDLPDILPVDLPDVTEMEKKKKQ